MNFSSLHNLLQYFLGKRGVGHTTAMLEGAKNSDCIVLVSNESIASSLKKQYPNTKFITESSIGNSGLQGHNKPLLIDHSVIVDILRVKQLQENDVPDQAIKIQKEKVAELEQEVIKSEGIIRNLQSILAEIVPTLAESVQVLNDLSNDHDGVDGDPEQVKESRTRIYKRGVKKYIAEIQEKNRGVLVQYNQQLMTLSNLHSWRLTKHNVIINSRGSGKTVAMKAFTDWQTARLKEIYKDQSI